MKTFFVLCVIALGFSTAEADQVSLNVIEHQSCVNGIKNVDLLNTKTASVDSECDDSGNLYTTVNYTGTLAAGTTIQLGNIDTNDCVRLQTFISLLSTDQVTINAVCSAYVPQGYASSDGRLFDYRLYTKMTVNN